MVSHRTRPLLILTVEIKMADVAPSNIGRRRSWNVWDQGTQWAYRWLG